MRKAYPTKRCLSALTHGHARGRTRTREYQAWISMKARCYDTSNSRYRTHGERGIRVCNRWLGANGFQHFFSDMGPQPTAKHSLDRKDNDGNYEPGNCRWATAKEQARNRRNNRIISHNGATRTLAEWAEISGVKRTTLDARLKRGVPIADALRPPIGLSVQFQGSVDSDAG